MYSTPEFEKKLCTRAELAARVAKLSHPLVFTNGCFDVLHRGHVTYLAQARALGASLVLGVNSDASVKRLGKGDDRPVNIQDDRMAVLAALEAIDLVVLFDVVLAGDRGEDFGHALGLVLLVYGFKSKMCIRHVFFRLLM